MNLSTAKKLKWAIILYFLFDFMTGDGGLIPGIYAQAGDVNLGSQFTSFTTVVRGSAWANINNAYIFGPNSQDASMCLELINNNPTSSHTVTIALNQTHDPSTTGFTGSPGRWVATSTVSPQPITVPAAGSKGIYFQSFGAAQLALVFSGASTQAGSPDTVDIFIVATKQGNCGIGPGGPISVASPIVQGQTVTAAAQFPIAIGGYTSPGSSSTLQGFVVGSQGNGFLLDSRLSSQLIGGGFKLSSTFAAVQGVSGAGQQEEIVLGTIPSTNFGPKGFAPGTVKTNFLEAATDQGNLAASSMPAWLEFQKVTNPAAGQFILGDYLTTTAAINVAWKWVTVSCSAACEFQVSNISSAGVTCTAVTPHNMQLYAVAPLTFNAQHIAIGGSTACGTQPTVAGAVLWDINLAAGTSYTLDVSGLVNFHQATNIAGLGVFNVSTLTGTMSATIAVVEE